MTTITWKSLSTNKCHIEIFVSKDKLEKTLRTLVKAGKNQPPYREVIKGKLKDKEIIHGVSYEDKSELAILRNFKLLPQEEDYPNGNKKEQ